MLYSIGANLSDISSLLRNNPSPEPVTSPEPNEAQEVQFNLKHINLSVPCGQLMAIVGAVGSGKMSLLQGLIDDDIVEAKGTQAQIGVR